MWLKEGLIFGSAMHLATGVVILIEFIFIIHQVFLVLEEPNDKKRQYYFWLLFLLLIYNVTGGLFPDDRNGIPLVMQYLLCYGGGLAISAYYPFFFYKYFALSALKFHVKYGVWLFLIGSFFLFFIIGFTLTNNISLAINCGMAIPLGYSFILLFAIGRAIYDQYGGETISNSKEVILMFISIFPWGLMAIMSIIDISQLQELILANIGFLFFRVFYVKEEFRRTKKNQLEVQSLEAVVAEKNMEISRLLTKFNAKVETEQLNIQSLEEVVSEQNAEILQLRDMLIKEEEIASLEKEKQLFMNLAHTVKTDNTNPFAFTEALCRQYGLTSEETAVMRELHLGYDRYKEIADRLNIPSSKTIESRMRNIFRKTGVNKKSELLKKFSIN